MSRFIMATMPFTGHVLPGLPIARKLIERGHEVAWYTGKKFQKKIEATGARFLPMKAAYDFDDADMDTAFPERSRLDGLERTKFDFKHVFGDPIPGQIADMEEYLKEMPGAVLLTDTAFAGGKVLSERGVTWAIFNITVLGVESRDTAPFGLGMLPDSSFTGRLRNRALYWAARHLFFRDVYQHFEKIRAAAGAPSVGRDSIPLLSDYLYLQPTVPGFEYPRSDLPPQVHFVGPLLPDAPKDFAPPAWWGDVTSKQKPVVLVTQGTLATEADHLIQPTLTALANEDVIVVATASPEGLDVPANARIVPFIPFAKLMPYVDVMVTNGGYGGVTMAMAHGVPMVAGGITEEKPEICNRIAYSGMGVNLKTATPTPEQVRGAVMDVLANARYRRAAERLQAECARYDAPTECARLLERLALTREPVLARQLVTGRIETSVAASGMD
jgi:MGT family glycosyltransferase